MYQLIVWFMNDRSGIGAAKRDRRRVSVSLQHSRYHQSISHLVKLTQGQRETNKNTALGFSSSGGGSFDSFVIGLSSSSESSSSSPSSCQVDLATCCCCLSPEPEATTEVEEEEGTAGGGVRAAAAGSRTSLPRSPVQYEFLMVEWRQMF